ncbi:MAG TPA: dihydropteroate synthase [Burkholderiaceae bacterium]|nr:dihydropteroate synthase [Burkholderiaceae bacterium]
MIWQTARYQIDLTQPKIMGIVNVTPDSFSDGGRYARFGSAIAHAEQLVKDGADILDLGGESSRPGALQVPLHIELERILPVLVEVLRWGIPISIDTYKPQVMQAVLDMGADIINDIWALRQPAGDGYASAEEVVVKHPSCGVCLMHMHREPQTMQTEPMQGDVVPQVLLFLEQRRQYLCRKGVDLSRMVVDPGIGFGKTTAQNFSLLARQADLLGLGAPVLAGWSRKTAIGAVTGLDMAERTSPSVVAAVLAVQQGAHIVRVHDVRETAAAFKVLQAVKNNTQHDSES